MYQNNGVSEPVGRRNLEAVTAWILANSACFGPYSLPISRSMNARDLVAFVVVALVGCGGGQQGKVAKLQKRVDYLEDKVEAMSGDDEDPAAVLLSERVEAHEERLGELATFLCDGE